MSGPALLRDICYRRGSHKTLKVKRAPAEAGSSVKRSGFHAEAKDYLKQAGTEVSFKGVFHPHPLPKKS